MASRPRRKDDSARPPTSRRARVEELEARVLLSADAPWAALDAALTAATHESFEPLEPSSAREPEASVTEQQASSRELVFVDGGIDDYETLVEDLLAQGPDTTRTIEVVVLQSDRDGISQISEALAGRSDLDAVHVVSHGSDEGIQLGGTWLTGATLDAYADSVAGWRDGLSEEADLLLYGCNLAGSVDGKALIDQLASLTGADVAASSDLTGAALLGGDWELEHATGTIESGVAFSAQARAAFAGVLDDTAIWIDNGQTTPEASTFDGLNFSPSVPTADVGNEWKVIAGAEAPTRDEAIVVGVGSDGNLSGMIWNGTTWVASEPFDLGIPNLSGTENWSIDVSYESQSGDALIVWSAGKDLGFDFGYSVWNGTSFTPPVSLDGPVPGEPIQLKLASNPTSDEVMLVATNENDQSYALIWDGDSWDTGKHFLAGDSSNYATDIAVAYEQQSGDAMVVFGDGTSDVRYRIWNGTNWGTPPAGIVTDPGGPASETRWITLASDPNSDRLVMGVASDFYTAWLTVWDGDTWEPSVLASNNSLHNDRQNVAVAFEATSGEAIAAYTRASQDEVAYQRWTAGGGWSGELTGPTLSSHPDSLTLDADPISDTLMLSVVDQNRQVSFSAWDGDAFGTPEVLGADAGTNKGQPFLFLWDQQPAAPNTLPTADASAGAPHVISEGGTLALDGSNSSDPDGSITAWDWDIGNDGSFEKSGVTAGYGWAELTVAGVIDDGTYDVALRVTDDGGAQNTQVFTLTVDNTAPTLAVTGPPSVQAGVLYTLNLSAVDPGDDSITGWTINWGDGTIETVGDVSSLTHTYTQAGFTRNITVSASDEDGTYLYGDAFLTSNATDSLYRFDATTGTLPQEFADLDGLANPVDVEIGPDGLIYATGFSSGDIRRYDATTGAFVDQFVTGLSAPPRMAFGPDGDLYVTNTGTDEVLRFDGSTGAPQGAFVTAGSGTLDFPDGIAFGPDGNLYVASSNNLKVLRYDGETGAFIDEFASGVPGFSDLKFGPDGNLYVSSTSLNTVQRFDGTTGVKIDDFVTAGSGGMLATAGFEWGPDGELYVVDWAGDRVLRYDGSDGSFIDEYIPSSGPNAPINLTFAPAHQVLITAVQNTAPLLNPAAPTLTPITEDDIANAGDLVSSIVGGSITDPDVAVEGIAITGLSSGNGTWEYSLDGGLIWNAVPVGVSDATALLLRDSDLVRFVPDGENADAASFDFRAWDQTTDAAGLQVDVSTNGGTTAFSLDSDTASIVVSAVNDAPTVSGTVAGQTVTDVTTVDPFTGVTIGDVDNPAQTLTVDVQLDAAAKGVLTNLGGFSDQGGGLYRFSGTATAATTALQGLTFDPSDDRVAPGSSETTTFTLTVDDGVAAPVVDATTTVIATSVNDAPTVSGTVAGQTVTDVTTVDPFTGVTIGDVDNPAQTLTVDVQLDAAAKGVLTNLGGFSDQGGGLYRFSGTATAATTALQGLTFDPSDDRVAPGSSETTTFTLTVDDGVAAPVVDATTTVIATSVNDAPTVSGTVAGQTVTDVTTVDPFTGVTIGDVDNPAQTLTVDVQLDAAAKGVLTNLGGFSDQGGGLYRFSGTATAATTALQGLTFDPSDDRVAPGSSETTTFTLTVDDGVAAPVVDATTTVIATSVNDAPTVSGTVAGQTVTDVTTVDPFTGVTIGDVDNPAQTLTVDVQLDAAAKGVLTNLGGFSDQGGGLYRFSGTATAATTALQGLTFDPSDDRVAPGSSETTTFTLTVDDGVAAPVVDATTTVIATSVNDAPTVSGTVAGQTVTDVTTVDPFTGVTIGDVDNPAQTLTVDVQLDAAAKGVLTNLGGFSDQGGGLYRFSGTATAATTALQGLTFDPSDDRVAPGSSETTTFTLTVDDGVAAPVVDATTTVIATSVNDAPTVSGTVAGQTVTDVTTVDPFTGVTIGDVDNPAQTLTVDVQLDAAAKGVLTNLGGFSDQGGGLYRFSGTATAATTALQGLTFDPSDDRVAPGSSETTTFTLTVDDGVAAPVVDATTTVIATSVNDAPTVSGTVAGQTVTDVTTVDPFTGVTIGDVDNPAQTLTVDVQLDAAAKGVLTNLGGFSDQGGGLYRFSGTATAATTALQGLTFDPSDDRVAPGSSETTTFTLTVDDGVAAPVVDATTTVIATSVNDAPTVSGTVAGQTVTDVTTVDPFTGVTIGDVDNPAQTLTVDVQLDAAAKGVLTNLGGFSDQGGGLYRFSGTATAATTALQGLTFDPSDDRVAPGSSETTTFTLTVDDGVAAPVVDATTTVIATSVNDAPTVSGTVAGQTVTDVTTVDPFTGVTIGDVDNPAQTLTVDVQLDAAAKGVLTNLGGFSDQGGGLYRFSGTATAATTALQGLTFDPSDDRVAPGSSETTTFTLTVDDGVAAPVVDATTTVIATSVNDAPTVSGTVAGQTVTDVTTVDPFTGVTIGDVDNPAQTLTVDVQLDAAAKGVLTNLGGFSDQGGGLYRFSGTATAATTALQGLTFDPSDDRVAPGSSETTTFTLTVDDGVAAPVVDATTTVIATSVNDAPTVSGTVAGQTVTDVTTVDPFTGVTIGDVDNPAQTLTVDVQLDAAAKGVLTNLGGFSDQGGGLYRFSGTATAATTALQGLTFDPSDDRVAPGSSETTTFTLTVDDGVAAPVVDATTTVIATSVNDAPTVSGTVAGQTVTDVTTVDPFTGVTIGDVDNPAQTLTVDVQLDAAAKGVLTNLGGFSDQGGGLYRFSGTATAATTALQGLTFDPSDDRVAPGSSETTTFTLTVDDGVAAPVVDATTTVIATSVNDAPTVSGTVAGQTVTDVTTVDPFTGVTIGDVDNPAQTLTVDVQLDAAAKGVLTNLGGFSDQGGGLYRFSGTATAATTALQGLTFDPSDDRVAPGSSETTTFTLTVDDGVAAPVVDATTTVIATSVNDAPTVSGTVAGQTVTDVTTVDPFTGVTIGDVDNPAQTLTVDVQLDAAAKGVLTNLGGFSDQGGGLYRFSGTATAATTALQGLTFDPSDDRVAPGSSETTTFTLTVDDGVAAPVVDATTTVIATSVNDAPVLDPAGDMTLSDVNESDPDPGGDTVAAIIASAGGDRITDADSGAVEGIAVVSVDDSNGSWQFSTDGGLIWTAFGSVSNMNAVLLDSGSLVRFVPSPGYTGSSGDILFHAWDQTTGANGQAGVDASSTGGANAFSVASDTATLDVNGVNMAPILTPSGPTLATITEDDVGNPGERVSAIVGGSISDLNASALEGIAVTGLSSGNGSWQHSLDGGTTWNPVPATVSDTAALLLRDSDRIRFVPDGQNADAASFDFRAWDQTSGSAGARVDVSTNGGPTGFSLAGDTASITVTGLNDAPRLGGAVLSPVLGDDLDPPGATIALLFGSSVTDVDAGSGFSGLAVIGNGADAVTQGVWQHSSDGVSWFAVGSVGDDASALALASGAHVRFVPVATYEGSPPSLVVRGLDDTYTGGFSSTAGGFEARSNIDTSTNGGVSHISGTPASLGTSILPALIDPDDLIEEAPLPEEEPPPEVALKEAEEAPAEEASDTPEAPPPEGLEDEPSDAPAPSELEAAPLPDTDLRAFAPELAEGTESAAALRGDEDHSEQATERTALDALKDLYLGRSLIDGEALASLIFGGERGEFMGALDSVQQDLELLTGFEARMVSSTIAATSGLSVGYVLWLTRGGLLVASLLSSLPAWRLIDPIPILASLELGSDDRRKDGESLDSLVRGGADKSGDRTDDEEQRSEGEAAWDS